MVINYQNNSEDPDFGKIKIRPIVSYSLHQHKKEYSIAAKAIELMATSVADIMGNRVERNAKDVVDMSNLLDFLIDMSNLEISPLLLYRGFVHFL